MSPPPRTRSGPAALGTALLTAVCLVAGCSSGSTPPPAGPRVTPTLSLPSGVTAVTVGGGPVGLVLGPDDRVWVALADDDSVVPLTPDGDGYAVGDQVPVGGLPLRVRIDDSGLWVSVFDRGQIVRVDPDAGTADDPIEVGGETEGLALTGDTLWVVDQARDVVVPVATDTGTVGTGVPVGSGPRQVAATGDGVVVTSYQTGTVTTVAADLTVRTSAEICPGVQGVVVDDAGRVFVTCTDAGELVVLDLATLTEIGRVGDLTRPDAVTVGTDGTVYVGLQRGPAIVAFDPETLTETGRVTMGDAAAGLSSNIDLIVDAAGQLLLSWPEQDSVLVVEAGVL